MGGSDFEGSVSVLRSETRSKASRISFASSRVSSCASQGGKRYSSRPEHGQGKSYPCGYPWLSQHTKRVNDAVTIEAAFMLALALATLTQNNTALALLVAEGGKAFYGEPCSWWQTEEVRLMSEVGATRSALSSCELVKKWTKQNRDKPGSMGIMTNFCVQCPELHEGWPQLSEAPLSHVGPLPVMCKLTSLVTARPQATAVEPLAPIPRRHRHGFPRKGGLPTRTGCVSIAQGTFLLSLRPGQSGDLLVQAATLVASVFSCLARVRGIKLKQSKSFG